MANVFVEVPANSTGEKISCVQLSDGVNLVDLQRFVPSDPAAFGVDARVEGADPGQADNGLVVRPAKQNVVCYHAISQATTNAVLVQLGAGRVFGFDVGSTAAYAVFVKLFDKATAPVPGTDSPFRTIQVQAGVPRGLWFDRPLAVVNGLGICIVRGIADADATPVAANDCCVDLFHI